MLPNRLSDRQADADPPHWSAMAESRTTERRALLAASAVAFVIFLVALQQVLTDGWLVTFDRNTAERIAHDRFRDVMIGRLPLTGRFVNLSRDVTAGGDVHFLLALSLVVGCILWITFRPRAGLFVVGATFGGALLDLFARSAISDVRPAMPRPFNFASQDGFPSGHALDATVCFGAIVIVMLPRLPIAARIASVVAAVGVVLAVAASRVALLVHYVSDVVAGIALGLAWLFLLAAVFRPWRERDQESRGSGASASI
jgi:membrane-associated phospholipid phosphatase